MRASVVTSIFTVIVVISAVTVALLAAGLLTPHLGGERPRRRAIPPVRR